MNNQCRLFVPQNEKGRRFEAPRIKASSKLQMLVSKVGPPGFEPGTFAVSSRSAVRATSKPDYLPLFDVQSHLRAVLDDGPNQFRQIISGTLLKINEPCALSISPLLRAIGLAYLLLPSRLSSLFFRPLISSSICAKWSLIFLNSLPNPSKPRPVDLSTSLAIPRRIASTISPLKLSHRKLTHYADPYV